MKDLEKLRKEIDKIDSELVQLFEKRMEIVSQISEYKRLNNMPIEDKNREALLIKKQTLIFKDSKYLSYMIDFLKSIISISKKMQKDKQIK